MSAISDSIIIILKHSHLHVHVWISKVICMVSTILYVAIRMRRCILTGIDVHGIATLQWRRKPIVSGEAIGTADGGEGRD